MSIKSRLLCAIIILQLIGFAVLVFRFSDDISDSLLQHGQVQVQATLQAQLNHFDALASEMERSARALALSGELIHAQNFDLTESERAFSELLLKTFRPFPQALGGGIWFEPYRYNPQQRLMGPYAYRTPQGVVFSWELNTPQYNYPQQPWYELAIPRDWPRHVTPDVQIYWTPPYRDEAGSESLMMTVDALMFDQQQHILGMATIDWSMEAVLTYLNQSTFTRNSQPFLFHPDNPQSLLNHPLSSSTSEQLTKAFHARQHPTDNADHDPIVSINDQSGQQLYAGKTRSGLILGVIVPDADFAQLIEQQRADTLTSGVLIALVFIAIVALMLEVLFKPFEHILGLLTSTVDANRNKQTSRIQPIFYEGNNEFTPIISTFNILAEQIETFTQRLSDSNRELQHSQTEIAELNFRLEEKVEERTRELHAKKEEAINALQQLKITQSQLINMEKYAAMGELVAGLAHEVNTPLSISMTSMEALQDQLDAVPDINSSGTTPADTGISGSAINELLQSLHENVSITITNLNQASDMISRFKQVTVDQASDQLRDFELGDYLTSIISSLRPNYKYRPIQVDLDCPQAIYLSSHPGAISQIITNLMMNSLIHAFEEGQSGHIQISATQTAEQLQISYRDDGKGMSPEVVEQLFEPFFTTRREQGGSGMGTHVVHQLVTQALQGEISVSSTPELGTRYTITLPRQAIAKRGTDAL